MRSPALLALIATVGLFAIGNGPCGRSGIGSVTDYRPGIAASIGLASGKATPPSPAVKVNRKDCTVCRGTGMVRTGDGLSTVECDNCTASALATTEPCHCPNGGNCICANGQCTCPAASPAPSPIKPASYTPAKAPPGYICGPNGCYPASSGAPASGNCATGNCGTASYGQTYRRAPVRGFFGRVFGRRR